MRTKLGGNRIADKSIGVNHLQNDIKIPENNLQLNYPTHEHQYKAALDIIRNSNPSLVKELDLVDVLLTIMQVADCRPAGMTLKDVLDNKASGTDFNALKSNVTEAMGTYSTLKEALDGFTLYLDNKINAHKGLISHSELDMIYNEVLLSRGLYSSLQERLDNMPTGGGTGGVTTVNVTAMTPWNAIVTLAAGQRDIIVPNPYSVGEQSIEVFEDSMLLMPGVDNDYTEVDMNTIRLNYDLAAGTQIRITGTNAGRLYDWCVRMKTSADQSDISTVYPYRLGFDDLVIYEDGLRLVNGVDYTEKDTTTITMVNPLPQDCNITICKRRY